MNPISVSYASTGTKPAFALDFRIVPFNVGYAVIVPNGVTASLTVDYTYDNVNDPFGLTTPVWISSPAITATTETTLVVPVQFIRVSIASISGGSVIFKLIQGTTVN